MSTAVALPRPHRSRLLACVIAVSAGAWLRADPVDLGDDLVYVRGEDAATLAATQNAVIDLRFTPVTDSVPTWVTAPDSRAKVVLLAGADATAWVTLFAHRAPPVLLLAPAGSPAPADLTIPVEANDLQATVTAIDEGADVAALARPQVEKRRFDESALVRHHNGDSSILDEAVAAATEAEKGEKDAPPPLRDPMLQRAVQILRGLRAMGKS